MNNILLLLLSAALVLFTACKDDDDECRFAEARAEIYMYDCPNFCDGDTVPGLSRYQDTLLKGRAVFYSLQPADSCIWWIGTEAEPRYGKKVELMFDGEYSDVRIRLICIRTSTCNGETRRSVDTTDHYIQVVEFSICSVPRTYCAGLCENESGLIHIFGSLLPTVDDDLTTIIYDDDYTLITSGKDVI
jgi:hypothetical protein